MALSWSITNLTTPRTNIDLSTSIGNLATWRRKRLVPIQCSDTNAASSYIQPSNISTTNTTRVRRLTKID